MSIKQRLQKLEKITAPNTKKYMCVITSYENDERRPHAAQPYKAQIIGGGGEDIVFSTREELETFGARPDIDLEILNVIIQYVDPTGE